MFLRARARSRALPIVPSPGFGFIFTTMITQTAGTILVMWLGEQITERGIGNGISLIIFIGIIGRLPNDDRRRLFETLPGRRSSACSPCVFVLALHGRRDRVRGRA